MTDLSRRAFLAGLLAAASMAACSNGDDGNRDDGDGDGDDGGDGGGGGGDGATGSTGLPPNLAAVELPSDPFTLGVASGDPDDTSVVLWTRLALDALAPPPADTDLPAEVTSIVAEVATDDGFATVVANGRFPIDDTGAHTVHAVVDGLAPATTYWYRFRIGAWTSPVGRTRTLPAPGDAPPVSLAVASCQRYGDGHWAAHRDIAEADVDLVVFLGDYVYEAESDAGVRALPGTGPAEATTVEDYRRRYAAARLDPHLAAAHAAHPWAVTWDDHEVDDDYAGNDDAGNEVDATRRHAAYQAWWEHQPVRLPPPRADGAAVHRRLRLGATADLVLLDTRQHRSGPACGGGIVERAACPDLDAGDRTMLGADQEAWLATNVDPAAAWTVVAQSVVLTPVAILDRINVDAWDGYPAARQRLLDALAPVPAANRVVLTGDIHIQLVGTVPDGTAEGTTELVAPSISSRAPEPYAGAAALLPSVAPNVRHAKDRRGWLRCDIDATAWRATYREVVDVADPDSFVVDGPSFTS